MKNFALKIEFSGKYDENCIDGKILYAKFTHVFLSSSDTGG